MGRNVCEEIRLVNNILQAEDFVRLRIQAGLVEIPVEHARKALQNGLMNVSAIYDGELVGMGRLVGDGAMYWYLQEIIILPQFQRKGIGTMIVNHLVDYARENSTTGKFTTIGGVSAKGKEPFYEKMGFEIIPNEISNTIEGKFASVSAGKVFVALGILQLIERGRIKFDDTLGMLLDMPLNEIDKDVTVKQLLNHTSGVPDYFDESVMEEYLNKNS